MKLSGIGENGAWTFDTGLFGWRGFRNRRELAAAVGLVPTPHVSEPSRWYDRRFRKGGRRMQKVGVAALARRLVMERWRQVEAGALPEGATLKA